MARVFVGGDEYFNAITGGTPHQGTINFIQGQFLKPSANLTEAGRVFHEKAKISVDQALNSSAMRLAQAAVRKLDNLWGEDTITYLRTIGAIQQAPIVMQRYIMAQPAIRKLYNAQKCDGYSDTYIDVYPGTIGNDHYDYRRVMDGVITFATVPSDSSDAELPSWESVTYLDELNIDDNDLLFESQVDIIDTWNVIENHLNAEKDDPTSLYNAELE